jgi:hypothetical protein
MHVMVMPDGRRVYVPDDILEKGGEAVVAFLAQNGSREPRRDEGKAPTTKPRDGG